MAGERHAALIHDVGKMSVPAEIVFQHDERGKYDGRVVQTCMRTFRDGHFGFSRVRFL